MREARYTTVACDSIDLVGLERDDRRRQLIPNGVDLQDIASDVAPSAVPTDRFRLSYVGTLHRATATLGQCSTPCGRL